MHPVKLVLTILDDQSMRMKISGLKSSLLFSALSTFFPTYPSNVG